MRDNNNKSSKGNYDSNKGKGKGKPRTAGKSYSGGGERGRSEGRPYSGGGERGRSEGRPYSGGGYRGGKGGIPASSEGGRGRSFRNKDSRDHDTRSTGRDFKRAETRTRNQDEPRRNFEPRRFAKEEGFVERRYVDVDQIENLQLEGRNAVMEALDHDKPIDKIFIKKDGLEGTLKVIFAKAREKGILVQEVDKNKLDAMSESGSHQGIIAVCPAHAYAEVEDILEKARSKNEEPFIIILDGITDPHNLGAIIRTADACGAHGVIIPKRRAVGLTGIVSKTSAGALEHVLIARVPNISRVLNELKTKGVWITCADMDGDNLFKGDFSGALALVIGSEGEGVGRLIKEKCDFNVKIPMYGEIKSLNASVAAGIFMFEVVRKRRFV